MVEDLPNWFSHLCSFHVPAGAEAKRSITCAPTVYLPLLDIPAVGQSQPHVEVAERGRPLLYLGLSTRLHYALGPLSLDLYGFHTLRDYHVPALVQSIKNKLPGEDAMGHVSAASRSHLFARNRGCDASYESAAARPVSIE